jgi:hypothetical protein
MDGGDQMSTAGDANPPRRSRLKIWRILGLLLAFYVVAQDGMRVLRFSRLDPGAGTFAMSYVRAPQFAPGFVRVAAVLPDGPMGKAGIAGGDHIRFDTDVRNDAVPIVGELRTFTLDHQGVRTRLQAVAVVPTDPLINKAIYARSLIIALSAFIAALFATFIIWRGGRNPATLLLGVSLAAYSLANSAPWLWFDSPLAREILNFFSRTIQTLSPVAFIAFALTFYAEFVGPVRRVAWQLLAAYAVVLFSLLAVSDYLDGIIDVWPVIGDGQDLYTYVRLAGSVIALICVAVGWRRCQSATQQRYAMLFAALFILVGARILYLLHLYLWQGVDRQYSPVELALAIAGTTISAPLFAYAILRHKALDLGLAISRTLVYGIISSGLLVIFALIEWGSERWLPEDAMKERVVLSAGVALTLTIVFDRIREVVQGVVERLLFRAWRENEANLRRFVHEADFVAKENVLRSTSVEAFAQFAQGASCVLYLRDGNSFRRTEGSAPSAPPIIDGDDPIAVAMRADPKPAALQRAGGAIQMVLVLPMLQRTQLEGFFALGPKPKGENYRPDEIALLGWAAQQIYLDLTALRIAKLELDISKLQSDVTALKRLHPVRKSPKPAAASSARLR